MTKLLVLLAFYTQVVHPVRWSYAAKRLNKTEAVLLIKADIDRPWHKYSVYQPDGGPLKTSFAFGRSKDYELAGELVEPKAVTKYEDAFKMKVLYFENMVVFQQRVKLMTNTVVTGSVKFMCCNDKQCLSPETVNFSIPVK